MQIPLSARVSTPYYDATRPVVVAERRSHKFLSIGIAAVASLALLAFLGPNQGSQVSLAAVTPNSSLHQCPAPNWASCLRQRDVRHNPLDVCVGIRGNGEKIYYHFTALARVVEAVGPIDAAAGGSSGSVATYILDAIQSNPLVVHAPCSEDGDDMVQRARTSFLLKSLITMNDFVNIINPFAEAGQRIKKDLTRMDIPNRLRKGGDKAYIALEEMLAYLAEPQNKDLVNPEFLSMVKNSPDPPTHALDALYSLYKFSQDSNVSSPSFFVRATPLRLQVAGVNHNIIGSFYAGYKPLDMEGLEYVLEQCAEAAVSKDWNRAKKIKTESGEFCGNLFVELVRDFVEKRKAAADREYPSRLEEKPKAGGAAGMASMISVGVIRDEGIQEFDQANESYFAASFNVTWDMNFDDVHFGYWGHAKVLKRARKGNKNFQDLKSRKIDLIGQATWRELLVRSPGEPGLTNGIRGKDSKGKEFISIGGWCDMVPAQMLSSIGCDRIVLITSPGSESTFQDSLETTLGANSRTLKKLNDVDSSTSSWSVALATADAAMCGEYDAAKGAEAVSKTGWIGPLVTDDECMSKCFSLTFGLRKQKKKRGCN